MHVAAGDHNNLPGKEFHEQTVEIALGLNGAFQDGNVAALTRRAAPKRILTATPARRAKSTSPRQPRTPRVAALLRKALSWEAQLESGDIANQAAIAAREGVTRARVTQVLGMLRLAPEIQEQILGMPASVRRPHVTERALRSISHLKEPLLQIQAFERLRGRDETAPRAVRIQGWSLGKAYVYGKAPLSPATSIAQINTHPRAGT